MQPESQADRVEPEVDDRRQSTGQGETDNLGLQIDVGATRLVDQRQLDR